MSKRGKCGKFARNNNVKQLWQKSYLLRVITQDLS